MPETETRGRWDHVSGIGPDRPPMTDGLPRNNLPGIAPGKGKSTGDKDDGGPAYYDISLLKPPV